MRLSFLFPALLFASLPAIAQVEFIAEDYFPADKEFEALRVIASENGFSDPAQLSTVADGRLIDGVGFRSFAQRIYTVGESGSLSVDIATLIDYRAAYALVTLLRTTDIQDGPPGDGFAFDDDGILFCHGKRWVRIHGRQIPEDLIRRVASSVSNRMGEPAKKVPLLIAHLPVSGLQTGSLKYFPSSQSFASYIGSVRAGLIWTDYEMEIAQANYLSRSESDASRSGVSGTVSLLKFPTSQMAEEYFSELSSPALQTDGHGIYFKRSGPLLSILEGSFDATEAGTILDAIKYRYSVQWIRDNQSQYTIAWGIPVHILNTTVWSFFFVLMLCLFSILAGAGIAGIRLLMRRFLPHNPWDDPERTEITRLKMS